MKHQLTMNEATFKSIRRLAIYLAPEEGKHYAESGKPKDHIFRDIMRVARWIDKNPLA